MKVGDAFSPEIQLQFYVVGFIGERMSFSLFQILRPFDGRLKGGSSEPQHHTERWEAQPRHHTNP